MTRGFARGAAVGALVLTGFGGFWALESVAHLPELPSWKYGVAGLPILVLLCFAVFRLIHAGGLAEASDADQAARAGRKMGMRFGIIFGIEGALIGAAAAGLAGADRPLLIPVAIALIVGLHFFPLARVFDLRVYAFTGAFCTIAAVASLLVADSIARLVALGFAMAAILWISAAVVLMRHTGGTRAV